MALATSGPLTLRRTPPMNSKEFTEIQKYIYDLVGIDIPERRKYLLENRLGPRLVELGLRNYGEYLMALRHGPDKDAELKYFFPGSPPMRPVFFATSSSWKYFKSMC